MILNNKIISIIFVLLLLFATTARAAESEDLAARVGVSTLSIKLRGAPGETVNGSFQVFNLGSDIEKVEIVTGDWDYNVNGLNRVYNSGTLKDHTLSNWLEITPLQFKLNEKERKNIKFNINIPEDKKLPRWGLILVKTSSKLTKEVEGEGDRDSRFYASKTYGIKIRLLNKNNIKNSCTIKNSKATYENKKLQISSLLSNDGTTFLSPSGIVKIINDEGKIIKNLKIKSFNILPGYERRINTSWQKELKPGHYVAVTVIDHGGSELVGSQVNFKVKK